MSLMLAANIWHWWVGLVLTVVGIGAVAAVAAGYIKQVSASRFPGKRQRRGHDEG
jgi:formate-dependent nitrite reductase membrane component NrfD